jgi:triosephosphate isomerase (TIM)
MKTPTIIINLKTYKQGTSALKLAKIIEKVNPKIIVGVQPTNISTITKKTNLQVFSQHTDYQETGRNTGFILPEAIKSNGAKGTFLNHSEHRLDFKIIKATVARCKTLKLKTAIFAKDLKQAKKIKKLKPDYLIIEPPELVAGKTSVTKARPQLIKNIHKNLGYKFIVGAGIKTNQDLVTAMTLGASGIALSSAITKSKNPKKKLKEILEK